MAASLLPLPPAHLPSKFKTSIFPPLSNSRRNTIVFASVSPSPKRTRKKKQLQQPQKFTGDGENGSASAQLSASSSVEKVLRLGFMEELMERARNADAAGVSEVIYDMIAAGLNPGPRSFHGLIVSNVLSRGEEGAMHALRRELSQEELVRNNHLEDANKVFLKGAEGGLRATDEVYDLIIEEDCKVGDHLNALTIAYEMEAAGRMATTFHFNCLFKCAGNLWNT